MLAKAGVEGKLATRADAHEAPGRLPQDRPGCERYARRRDWTVERRGGIMSIRFPRATSPRDHRQLQRRLQRIKNNLNRCIDAINGLLDQGTALATAAAEGELNTRADDSKFQGEYRDIIQGMNRPLEGFAVPLADIGQTLHRMADKDFTQTIDKQYPGAYGDLRDNVNLVIDQHAWRDRADHRSANQFAEGLA